MDRLPTIAEARYLRLLVEGMFPASEIPTIIRKVMAKEGWISIRRAVGREAFARLEHSGTVALQRYDENQSSAGQGGGN